MILMVNDWQWGVKKGKKNKRFSGGCQKILHDSFMTSSSRQGFAPTLILGQHPSQ
jgi:hypothetical protein